MGVEFEGGDLWAAAAELARSKGTPAITLWVDPDDMWVCLRYESLGFLDASGVPGAIVFILG